MHCLCVFPLWMDPRPVNCGIALFGSQKENTVVSSLQCSLICIDKTGAGLFEYSLFRISIITIYLRACEKLSSQQMPQSSKHWPTPGPYFSVWHMLPIPHPLCGNIPSPSLSGFGGCWVCLGSGGSKWSWKWMNKNMNENMEQRTGSKSGKEYVKAVYCHPAHLTSMQSISCKMTGWMKHKLESRLLG